MTTFIKGALTVRVMLNRLLRPAILSQRSGWSNIQRCDYATCFSDPDHTAMRKGQRFMSTHCALKGEPFEEAIRRLGVKFVLFSFTDLFGTLRSKMVPVSQAPSLAKNGAGFAAFANHLDYGPDAPDVLATPDPRSLMVLPWNTQVAWVACDLSMGDSELKQGPRMALKRVLHKLKAEHNLTFKTGVELEFHLLSAEQAHKLADSSDTATKPCYSIEPLMKQFDLIAELQTNMELLGWHPYQADHEDSCGQFELNWRFDDALVTADRHAFFKWMVREAAARRGMVATFMPKPFTHLTGNSAHVHLTLHDAATDANVLAGSGPLGLSPAALHLCGGLLAHAPGYAAVTNPTVNSYKRINAVPTRSGATWSPSSVSWTGNNRTHMIRVPDAPRFEVRVPDSSANPYLLPAALLVAGLDGIARRTDPGPPMTSNVYEELQRSSPAAAKAAAGASPAAAGVGGAGLRLPLNLLDALRALEADQVITDGLGPELVAGYIRLRRQQWDEYARTMSAWELDNTLDA